MFHAFRVSNGTRWGLTHAAIYAASSKLCARSRVLAYCEHDDDEKQVN
jgi:hypothetical protein